MKNILILIILIISIGCKKSRILNIPETAPAPVYFGTTQFYNNGILQNLFKPIANIQGAAQIGKNYVLSIYLYDSKNFRRLGLEFSNFYFKPSNYTIKRSLQSPNTIYGSTVTSSYAILGGDAVEEIYFVDSTKNCSLNINQVDSITKELWGSFNGTYVLQRKANTPLITQDTVEITNGTFHSKVFE